MNLLYICPVGGQAGAIAQNRLIGHHRLAAVVHRHKAERLEAVRGSCRRVCRRRAGAGFRRLQTMAVRPARKPLRLLPNSPVALAVIGARRNGRQ